MSSMGQLNGKAYKGQIVGDPGYSYDDKYIWGAEEILILGDERLEYIHQFRGYATDKGWNVTVQAMIPTCRSFSSGPNAGYRWATTRRYFRKQRFPNAKTVKDVILEVAQIPYMIEPLTTEYEGYKVVDKARKSGIKKEELQKISSQITDKYGKGWTYKNPAAQKEALEIINGIKL